MLNAATETFTIRNRFTGKNLDQLTNLVLYEADGSQTQLWQLHTNVNENEALKSGTGEGMQVTGILNRQFE